MLDHQGAAGILSKLSDERKRGEAFPTIKISEQNETISLDVVPSLLATSFLHLQPLQFPDVRPSAHAQAGPIQCPGNHRIGPEICLCMAGPADALAPWSDQRRSPFPCILGRDRLPPRQEA